MDRQLIDYLPPVLRDVAEFRAINAANEPEISRAWESLEQVMANQFIDDADEYGVQMWEQELKILPKGTDTLEARKARIRSQWNLELPYTLTWLRRWITATTNGLPYEMSVKDYTLAVRLSLVAKDQYGEVAAMLKRIVPANMAISLTLKYNQHFTHADKTHEQLALFTHDQLRNEVTV